MPGQSEMPYTATTTRGLTSRDGLWFAVAASLHAGLLLLPFSPESDSEPLTQHSLLIELKLERPVARPFVQKNSLTEPDSLEPIEPERFQQQIASPPDPAMEIVEQADTERPNNTESKATPAPVVSTAVLLQSAADQDWPLATEATTRKLGVFVPQEIPENWRPGITLNDNLFNGMTVPRRVEVVDRWLSPDGTHHVVINTPTGDTFCGRGLAWDPMQPLVEHTMMFRSCAGGGKRTFEMPARYRKTADNSVIVNSTTN